MQIYLEDSCLYDFNQQKAFEARYMAKNPLASHKHKKYDANNVKYRGIMATKS